MCLNLKRWIWTKKVEFESESLNLTINSCVWVSQGLNLRLKSCVWTSKIVSTFEFKSQNLCSSLDPLSNLSNEIHTSVVKNDIFIRVNSIRENLLKCSTESDSSISVIEQRVSYFRQYIAFNPNIAWPCAAYTLNLHIVSMHIHLLHQRWFSLPQCGCFIFQTPYSNYWHSFRFYYGCAFFCVFKR